MTLTMDETGVPRLDDVIGGLFRHSLTMVVGAPGTGKTVLALQIATHRALAGSDVIVLSAYSESVEKMVDHMSGLAFFRPDLIGEKIALLSLKSVLQDGGDKVVEFILRTARGKRQPFIVIDGYRGIGESIGIDAARNLVASLSSQLPYVDATALITAEGRPHDESQYAELTSADVLIGLWNEYQEAQPVRTLEVLKVRGHSYLEGFHGLTITKEGITVFPRLATRLPSVSPRPTPRRYTFGLPEFDTMLHGGLPEYSSTIFFGDGGTGRTTFSLHYLLEGVRQGEKGLMLTLRNSLSDLVDKADNLDLDLQSQIDAGSIHVMEVPPVEINPYALACQIREAVETLQPRRLVIDTLTDLERASFVKRSQRDYLTALSLYLRRAGLTSVMTADTGSLHATLFDPVREIRMPAASNRILLRRVAFRGRFHRICSIVNMERSDHDTTIREFSISRGGVRVFPAEESEVGVLLGIAIEQPAGDGLP